MVLQILIFILSDNLTGSKLLLTNEKRSELQLNLFLSAQIFAVYHSNNFKIKQSNYLEIMLRVVILLISSGTPIPHGNPDFNPTNVQYEECLIIIDLLI